MADKKPAEIPPDPDISETLQQWMELLEHSKTMATTLTCLVYIGNAYGAAGLPSVRVKIRELDCENTTKLRAHHTGGEIIEVAGYPDLHVEIFPSNDPRKDKKEWIASDKCMLYAKQLAAVINSVGRRCNEGPGLLWQTAHFLKSLVSSKEEKAAWTDIRRIESTAKVLRYLTKFFTSHENGAFTEEVAQTLLNAVVSIDRGTHRSASATGVCPLFEATKVAKKLPIESIVSKAMYHVLKVAAMSPTKMARLKRKDEKKLMRLVKIPGEKTHLVSLDGGGIRGLVLTTILAEIERVIPGFFSRIKWTAGTSTGSILALALSQGKTVGECRNIYFKFKDLVFTPTDGINYDVTILESFLKKVYGKGEDGEDLTMLELGEKSGKKIISTSICEEFTQTYRELRKEDDVCSQNTSCGVPDPFRDSDPFRDTDSEDFVMEEMRDKKEKPCPKSVFIPADNDFGHGTTTDPNPKTTTVFMAARCTSAAPSYFHSPGDYIDGGVCNNNPTVLLLEEFLKFNLAENDRWEEYRKAASTNPYQAFPTDMMPLGAVVSIGTGKAIKEPEPGLCHSTSDQRCHDIRAVLQFLFKMKGEIGKSDGQVVELSKTMTQSYGGSFFRFTPIFENEIEMDETNNQTLIEMMWTTKMYMRRQTHFLNVLKRIFDADHAKEDSSPGK